MFNIPIGLHTRNGVVLSKFLRSIHLVNDLGGGVADRKYRKAGKPTRGEVQPAYHPASLTQSNQCDIPQDWSAVWKRTFDFGASISDRIAWGPRGKAALHVHATFWWPKSEHSRTLFLLYSGLSSPILAHWNDLTRGERWTWNFARPKCSFEKGIG